MLSHFAEFNHPFTVWDELRRRLDRVRDEYEVVGPDLDVHASSSWPKVNVIDAGDTLVFRAEVPGVAESDFDLSVTAEGVTLSGERKTVVPEGYSVQRQERPAAKFSRSWTLPYKVDPDKTTAILTNGVLTITLTKAREAQPRHIAVRAQA
jgi:HSP20 family protein